MNRFLIVLVIVVVSCCGSCKNQVNSETPVYSNDFENNSLAGITNGSLTQFNGTNVLGRYSNGSFVLTLTNLPKHNLVSITFDLYIHDNWRGQIASGSPDIWQMMVDDATYISTTFSNLTCKPGYICPPQSYPDNYPNNNHNPRSASFRSDLPGVCSTDTLAKGTTSYKIKKTFTHSGASLSLKCVDKLSHGNQADPICDKSWSVDNINITAISL